MTAGSAATPASTRSPCRELVRRFLEMSAIQRRRLAVSGLLPVAVLQDDLRRAFHQQHLLTAGAGCSVAMKRCSDSNGMASIRGYALLGLPVHPELGRERVEGALGRIALHRPDALAGTAPRRCRAGHAAQQLENRVLARRAVLLDLALGRVAVAGDLVPRRWPPTTIISIRVSVPVLSEQMRDTEPRVSTAGRRRTMALRWAIRCTPIASVIVMIAGRPSGSPTPRCP